ncbi:hypothetical protein H310_00909 [Aphanomyces invadans]|uniref:alpha-1,2-Mannosidase n=1 Tax=Aphanomyces invadans TaxID=157072 RepID=A0A024URN1_9STRA|nr:hypothetical protein H310_00909 [Aphanomyces invadans]ETW08288.1 hypothetical protein H310_00909 [Aphanomyces invadans]|eukprot:XP_008862093.1 hypothetical protein H310_00909 [Aphanomyces invadans]
MSSRYQWVLAAGAVCCFLNVMYLASKYGMLEVLIPKNPALRRVTNAPDPVDDMTTATNPDITTTTQLDVTKHSIGAIMNPLVAMPTLQNDTAMQRRVVGAMSWAWDAYRKHAFGFDSLNVQEMVKDGLPGHDMAISLVDSLDTLYIMGLREEFNEAVDWAEANLAARYPLPPKVSIFETTIRNLGGLLSAYTLCRRPSLLSLADDLGERLHRGLKQTALPLSLVSLIDGSTSDSSYVAEFTTIQLEFKYLAHLTGKTEYRDTVEELMDKVAAIVAQDFPSGVLPVIVDSHNGKIHPGVIKLGAGGDSYYEYLLKQWLFSDKRETKYKDRYMHAVNGIMTKLVGRTKKSNWLFLGELSEGTPLRPKMDHLVCFIPGMLALGYVNGMPESHLTLAKELLHTCYQMYNQMASKLAPEIAYFNTATTDDDIQVHPQDAFNILRPETVESLMILYRVTKDERYRQWGVQIFDAFERNTRLDTGGFSSVGHVDQATATKFFRPTMDSFFMAETLKYFYLLFSDEETIPLYKYVFNTEAHPFPIQRDQTKQATSTSTP